MATPCFFAAASMARAGCSCREESGPATCPYAPIRARTGRPSRAAASAEATTRAAAPSEIGLEEAAVMIPSRPKAGRSPARPSAVTPERTPSSTRTTTGSPRRCATSTGVISAASSSADAIERWCERAANASDSARVTTSVPVLQVSVRDPMAWSVKTSQRPSYARWSRSVTSP